MIARTAAASLALIFLVCCESKSNSSGDTGATRARTTTTGQQFFRDATQDSGIDYVHDNGATGRRYAIEILTGGVGFFDYDSDGDFDLYFVDAMPLDEAVDRPNGNRLYENDGAGRFRDVTAAAGVGHRAFGIGLAVGDIDNDGDPDLYVTNFGPNTLYLNNSDGTFERVADARGAATEGVSTAAIFFDYDRDGSLDLYVSNYLDFTLKGHQRCYIGDVEIYCGPAAYNAVTDHLYRGTGGRFEETTESTLSGVAPGKGLGVVSGDFNDDGWPDLYVANDGTANHLLINNGDSESRHFVDEASYYGAAFGENAKPEAGMGTDFGDVDGDGDLDITVTNLEAQTTSLYLNDLGEGALESSFAYGLGSATLPYVSFGIRFLDFDVDMDLDLLITNGHVIDNVAIARPGTRFEQPDQLFEQRDGKFVEVFQQATSPNLPLRAGRGLATADIDNDGDLDAIIANNGAAPILLENIATRKGESIGLLLEGKPPRSNRDAFGARVTGEIAGKKILHEVRSTASYLSANDPRLLISAPKGHGPVELTIRWPSGDLEKITVTAGAYHTVRESEGVISKTAFRQPRS